MALMVWLSYANVILDIQAVVFAAFDHALQPQLIFVCGTVDADALQPDEVMLGWGCSFMADATSLLQAVNVADEVADEFRLGVIVYLVGRADLLDDNPC